MPKIHELVCSFPDGKGRPVETLEEGGFTHYKIVSIYSLYSNATYRVLPSLIMNLVLPGLFILCLSNIQNLRLIQHFMMEAEDSLIFEEGGSGRCWS